MRKAPKIIRELVEKFERNLDAYKSGKYKEEQLRQEFINPFFDALGWDVHNKGGAAPQYRDVIHEDSIKIAGGTKAPDYCFTLTGRRMFFVEVKKPSVDIKRENQPAYQLRRYAWTAGLPLSILTDFEEFSVYECRKKPKIDDKVSVERIRYLTYKDYIKRWDAIYNTFSREAVVIGAFDKYIEDVKKKVGTQEVDKEFLSEIEKWRDELARNTAIRNIELSVQQLNYAVQRTIDRIIFLRMCEDRGIEKYGTLRKLLENEEVYAGLCKLYIKADDKYNSGLFHFKKERDRDTLPDKLTLNLTIDDKVLKNIIKNLYYPDSPYEFSVFPPEILGNVYEQFLGKVIRLTSGHRAKVEEKPEVKKAGGVYYTPKSIVDYIVENTVGKIYDGKTPNQIAKLRILDPACGSGSFLLGAYDYLLKYHQKYYSQHNPKRRKDQVYQGKDGEWLLTLKEKKRILLNNIYGVDIDEQAVEVTKLSLLLKVLEGEHKDIFERQQKLWQERALPDLGNNIKCGNSLIGTEYFGQMKLMINEEEARCINPFDWGREFPEIISAGGFDAIIGNPPYLSAKDLNKTKQAKAIKSKFGDIDDLYSLFIRKVPELLKDDGIFSFIVPDTFMTLVLHKKIRDLFKHSFSTKVLDLSPSVFKSAYVFNAIIICKKVEKPSSYIRVGYLDKINLINKAKYKKLSYEDIEVIPNEPIFHPTDWYRSHDKQIIEKVTKWYHGKYKIALQNANAYKRNEPFINKNLTQLKPYEIVFLGLISKGSQGLVTGNNSRFIGFSPLSDSEKEENWNKFLNKLVMIQKDIQIKKYSSDYAKELYEKAEELKKLKKDPTLFGKKFTYRILNDSEIRDFNELSANEKSYGIKGKRRTWIFYHRGNEEGQRWKVKSNEYLDWSSNSVEILKNSKNTNSRWQGYEFYFKSGFGWVDYFTNKIKAFYVEPTVYSKNVVKFHSEVISDLYILGLLNSTYIAYYVKKYITNTRTLQINDGKLIPILIPPASIRDSIIAKVQKILTLKEAIYNTDDDLKAERLNRIISNLETEIDNIVFELYGFDLNGDKDIISQIKSIVCFDNDE